MHEIYGKSGRVNLDIAYSKFCKESSNFCNEVCKKVWYYVKVNKKVEVCLHKLSDLYDVHKTACGFL